MSFTAFGTSDNLPSSWPAGVKYDPNSSRYVYSVSNAFQISALQHVHVIDIDVVPTPPATNTMSLTLPIMKNLPLESRLYFFYVTNSSAGDQLTFLPVSLSGNTVNGNALGYSFILSGSPELYIAIGIADNYIIHAFGKNNPGPTNIGLPTEYYDYNEEIPPIVGPTFSDFLFTPATKDLYAGNASVSAPVTVVTGMEGFLTREVPVPTQTFHGYRCNTTGMYLVNPQIEGRLYYAANAGDTNLGGLQANFLEFNADGSYSKASTAPSFVPFDNRPVIPEPLAGLMFDFNDTETPAAMFCANEPFAGAIDVGCYQGFAQGGTLVYPPGVAIGQSNALLGQIVPNQTFNGDGNFASCFQVLKAGTYEITYHVWGAAEFDAAERQGGGRVVLLSAAGALKQVYKAEDGAIGGGTAVISNFFSADTVKVNIAAGDYVWITTRWGPNSSNFVSGEIYTQRVEFLYLGEFPVPPPAIPELSTIDFRFNSSFLFPMEATKIYVPSFTWDDSSEGILDTAVYRGNLSFVYWAEFATPAPELMLALRSAASSSEPSLAVHAKNALAQVQAANTNPEVFSTMSKPLSGAKASFIQRSRLQEKNLSARQGSSSSSSSQQPMFTLNDMERMINQALDSREARDPQVVITASSSSSSSSASSSSSSSSSVRPPDSKKRKISFAKK